MIKNTNVKGFTLIEIMITVSIVLILASIGVPIYKGYLTDARLNLAKQNLKSIYLAESNYYFENNKYFYGGNTCDDHSASIQSILFNGENNISSENFTFCIVKNNEGYQATASQKNGNIKVSIDHLNNLTYTKNN